jgi:DNA-binding transcriptional LysR family regulator
MNRLDLRHFRYAVAVADTLHFGKAAERLHISQPPLSQQIRQLEEELGFAIFHRTKRHVRLTKAGEMFIAEARVVLVQVEHAATLGERIRQGDAGRLKIAVAGAPDARPVIDVLRALATRHPDVRIELRQMNTLQQVKAIRETRIHAGLLNPPVDDPAIAVETVMHQPIAVAVPRLHPLAQRRFVPLGALAAEPHIMIARRRAARFVDSILGACRAAGFSPTVAHEVDDLQGACALVAAGLGICLVPAHVRNTASPAIQVLPIRPELLHVDSDLALAYKRDVLCPLVNIFVTVVRDVVAGTAGGNQNAQARTAGTAPAPNRARATAPKRGRRAAGDDVRRTHIDEPGTSVARRAPSVG